MTDVVALEDSLRAYIAAGSGLALKRVVPADQNTARWKLPFATIIAVEDPTWVGYPSNEQLHDDAGEAAGTFTQSVWQSVYRVEFHREGALALARRFMAWSASEGGLDLRPTLTPPFEIVDPLTMQRVDIPDVGDRWEQHTVVNVRIEWAASDVFATGSVADWRGSFVADSAGGRIERQVANGP